MICTKCKKDFDPQSEGTAEVVGGYKDTVELAVTCPHCHQVYSAWVEPMHWSPVEE